MPDIRIVTNIAARASGLPLKAGAMVGDGDDLGFCRSDEDGNSGRRSRRGHTESIPVAIDEVVAEGQVLAILQT